MATSIIFCHMFELIESKNLDPSDTLSGGGKTQEPDYENRFKALSQEKKTLRNILDVLHCYPMLDNENLVNELIKYVAEINDELIVKLPVGAQKTIRSLTERLVVGDAAEGWLGWLKLANEPDVNSDVNSIIENNYKNWQVSDLFEN